MLIPAFNNRLREKNVTATQKIMAASMVMLFVSTLQLLHT
jgi:hypothetical protein